MKTVRWTKLFGGSPPPAATHIVDLDAALLGALGGFVVGAAAIAALDWGLTHATGISLLPDLPLWEHGRYWLHAVFGDETWAHYLVWLDSLKADGRYPSYLARLAGTLTLPLWLAWMIARSGLRERERFIHRAGRQLIEGHLASEILKRKTETECQADGRGLSLHPSVTLSLKRETGHLLVMGSSGGGKTVTLKPLIWRAVERGDRVIIYDNKGDITEELPCLLLEPGADRQSPQPKFALIAPWDRRSAAWDIAADCINSQDARELAAKFIPDSRDPMWSAAAQQIFTALLLELMHTRGTSWGWGDLADMVVRTNDEIKAIVARRVPEAMDAVADAESKTTQSIVITLKSFCSYIFALAEAWRDKPGEAPRLRVSFVKFLTDAHYPIKRVVLQGSGRYQKMTQKLIGGILQSLSATMSSGGCPDSRKRRIWLFLDEFPQLGKVEGFNAFLEVGRSKGFRVVIGAQDYNQFTTHYSREETDTFLSQIKTSVYMKFPPGATAQWLADLVGTRRVQVPQQSLSNAVGGQGGGSVSVAFNEIDLPVIHPADLEAKLGPSPHYRGVQGLLLGWDDVFILRWPFVPSVRVRPAVVDADWCTIVPEDPEDAAVVPTKPKDGKPVSGGGADAMDGGRRQRLLATLEGVHGREGVKPAPSGDSERTTDGGMAIAAVCAKTPEDVTVEDLDALIDGKPVSAARDAPGSAPEESVSPSPSWKTKRKFLVRVKGEREGESGI